MPWKETSAEGEQISFVRRWQMDGVSFVELCRRFGISRKTGYKRVQRFQRYSWDGVGDRRRAPSRRPNTTPRIVAERVIAARQAHPTWGPKKVVAWLWGVEPEGVPTRRDEHSRGHPGPRRAGATSETAPACCAVESRQVGIAAAENPNDVWSIDLKGWFRTGDGVRMDPLTVQDAASRYLLVCHGLQQPRGPEVKEVLKRALVLT